MSTITGTYVRLLAAVHRADLLARRSADRHLGARIGTGRAGFLTLDLIADAGAEGVSQHAIADRVGITRAAVSRLIRGAEQQGWLAVRVSAHSGREHAVSLTPAGADLVAAGRRARAEADRAVARAIGASELAAAASTIERLCDLLAADDA